MLSRRDLLKFAGQTGLALGVPSSFTSLLTTGMLRGPRTVRCLNVVNFIRGVEPRFTTDLLLPVQKQMELVLEHRLPATWLLQYDALVAGPFVPYLKAHMATTHEVGFWFEMNEMLCRDAKVTWRGRPGYEWDHLPPVAFTIGYTPEERQRLADAAMQKFREIWGRFPSSVASWNLDAITMAHLSEAYGVDAFAVCRDQIATDGFTIWGAPIAGYYPSRTNCWSPAQKPENQISTPVFRMLGQDPVYYYDGQVRLPGGRTVHEPDTMEPVWTSGRSPSFVREFYRMIETAPTGQFAYAQLGQENSFPWPDQAEGLPPQMAALAELRDRGHAHVETMGDSGRRFKRAFSATPPQAQVMLTDPFGNTDPAETTVWYQSRFYRANLHMRGDLPFLRDLTVYSDRNPQPFLQAATRELDVEQRMPAILDGFHWRKTDPAGPGAGGFFALNGTRLRMSDKPTVRDTGRELTVTMPVGEDRILRVRFDERGISVDLGPRYEGSIALSFEWDTTRAALQSVAADRANFRWQNFDYGMRVRRGRAEATSQGFMVSEDRSRIELELAQPE